MNKIHAVEVSGVCNLESYCSWCPMFTKPRNRKRGLMSDETVERALYWVSKLDKVETLALHVFGEPLLHPKLEEIAMEFNKLLPVTISTNGVLVTKERAARLSKVNWAWVGISPWKEEATYAAKELLYQAGVNCNEPPGVVHNWAGQVGGANRISGSEGCPFLYENMGVIRWDGSVATCCISDREEDVVGHVNQEPEQVSLRPYSICDSCHLRGKVA